MKANITLANQKRIGTTPKMFDELKGLFPVFMKQPAWFIKGMLLCELVTRFYVTIMIAIIGGFEADSHRTFIIYVSIALVIDVARNLFNRDVRLKPTIALAKKTDYLDSKDVMNDKSYKITHNFYKWIAIFYMFLCVVIYMAPENITKPITEDVTFQAIYKTLATISNAMRTTPQDLLSHNYPADSYRIALLLVVGNIISYLAYIQIIFGIPIWLNKYQVKKYTLKPRPDFLSVSKKGLKGCIVFSFIYLACNYSVQNLIVNSWNTEHNTHLTDTYDGGLGYLHFSFCYFALSAAAFFSYMFLLNMKSNFWKELVTQEGALTNG